MSLQIDCFVAKSVTIRPAKKFEDLINVVRKAYVVVVSLQPHTNFVFLHRSSCKFSDNGPIHSIYIIHQTVES